MRDCHRDGCTKPAHKLDRYCSRLCCEVDNGQQPPSAIADHERWLRTHASGGKPQSYSDVRQNVAGVRAQGGAEWASDAQ